MAYENNWFKRLGRFYVPVSVPGAVLDTVTRILTARKKEQPGVG